MPIYEYSCEACNRRASLFFRSLRLVDEHPTCPHCGEQRLRRRMSRFWSHTASELLDGWDDVESDAGMSSDAGWDSDDPFDAPGSEEFSPAEFARQAREMAAMSGEPLDEEFNTALDRIESGADPEEVFGELDERSAEAGDLEH